MPNDEDISIEKLEQLRNKYDRFCEEKIRLIRYRTVDKWFMEAENLGLSQIPKSARDLIISVGGNDLPNLGFKWAGLLLIDRSSPRGYAWFNEVDGLLPFVPNTRVVLKEGKGRVDDYFLKMLINIFEHYKFKQFRDVKDKCFDGEPTFVRMKDRSTEHIVYANASDSGREPTLRLVRVLHRIRESTVLEETRNC